MEQSWQQIYKHRTLAEILVGRELKARYRGTLLGFFWSFVNPLMMMSIYVLVFNVYMRINIPNYPIFVLCGLLPWVAFSTGLIEGMNSIISNGHIIKRIYLPSEVFPFVSVSSNIAHFLLSLPVLFFMVVLFNGHISMHILVLPFLLILQFFFTYALALILASFAVQFRDLVHIVPNLVMIWLYLTPIFYEKAMVPEKFLSIFYCNPMGWLIQAYRDIFFYHQMPSAFYMALFAMVSLGLMLIGTWLFQKRSDMYGELV